MQKLSEQEIIKLIKQQKPFVAELNDESILFHVKEYAPCIGTAIHNGHKLRSDLQNCCLLSNEERRFEEDPYTDAMVEPLPISVICQDSRYEYDLNREEGSCIYDKAWGKQVWGEALTGKQRNLSLAKHTTYYKIMNALVNKLESLFGRCLVFDIHSYNFKRIENQVAPTFNIGTNNIDNDQWQSSLQHLLGQLSRVKLPNLKTVTAQDEVFQGKGYQVKHGRKFWPKTLVIPLEVKKVYMDETSGEVFPVVLEKLCMELYHVFTKVLARFTKSYCRFHVHVTKTGKTVIEPVVLQVDKALYKLAKHMDTLIYINPLNIKSEKKTFFQKKFKYTPNFRYRQLREDPYSFREKIYSLPVSAIQDPVLKSIYRQVIDSYANKIELITNIGKHKFLYNSLRYYGEPTQKDINNATYLLHTSSDPDMVYAKELIDADAAKEYFIQALDEYGISFAVNISRKLVAKAMVDNSKKQILLNSNLQITKQELDALINHELGVHTVTTMNSQLQRLRVFGLGTPGNTHTQEGLAILSEYLSGNLSINRLKELSLRAIAVKLMLNGATFTETFENLVNKYGADHDHAFTISSRIYRGGGFTKDFLYLQGFRNVLSTYLDGNNIEVLFIGKTSLQSLSEISNLYERGIVVKPKYLPKYLYNKKKSSSIIDYLVTSIK